MTGDIQSFNREPSQMRIEVRCDFANFQAEPFRNCSNENARNQFCEQCPVSAPKASQLLPEEELASCQRAERRVGPAISDDFLTAEDSKCVGIGEHAENDARIALRFFVNCCREPGKRAQSLSFFPDPGRQDKWINPATEFRNNPRDFIKADELVIPADCWLLAHYARFMDLRFHTRCHYDSHEWQLGDVSVTNV